MTKAFNKKLTQLADLFNDYHDPLFVPTKIENGNEPISLPPTKMANLTKPQDPQLVVNERVEELEKLSHTTTQPPLTKENEPPITKPQLPKPTDQSLLTKQQLENIQHEELQELQQPKRGRPKGSKNKRTIEKLSQQQSREQALAIGVKGEKLSHQGDELMLKKLSQAQGRTHIPVDIKISQFTSGKGQTSLSYALLYASQLTPMEISILLENADTLELTMAEVLALSLLERTKNHDQKAEKIYWDLLKTQAKNEKSTPIKQETTLLDEALAKAENAIFGEVVDNPNNP